MECLKVFQNALRSIIEMASRPDPLSRGTFESLLVELEGKLAELIEKTEGFQKELSKIK